MSRERVIALSFLAYGIVVGAIAGLFMAASTLKAVLLGNAVLFLIIGARGLWAGRKPPEGP